MTTSEKISRAMVRLWADPSYKRQQHRRLVQLWTTPAYRATQRRSGFLKKHFGPHTRLCCGRPRVGHTRERCS